MTTISVPFFDRYGNQCFAHWDIPMDDARRIAASTSEIVPAEGLCSSPGEYGAQGWTGLTLRPEEVRFALGVANASA